MEISRMKKDYNANIQILTKRINRFLRDQSVVTDWFFDISEEDDSWTLSLWIDYNHGNFHSRETFDLERYDFEELEQQFRHYYNLHLKELEEYMS